MSETYTWDQRFAAVDKAVADMSPVANACSTCKFADVPPLPDDPAKGWVGFCRAPLPVNTLLDPSRVQLSFAAADAARWDSKRQKSCPAWSAEQ
jgi:hypothetical protein